MSSRPNSATGLVYRSSSGAQAALELSRTFIFWISALQDALPMLAMNCRTFLPSVGSSSFWCNAARNPARPAAYA